MLFGSGDGGVSGIQLEFITPQCTTFVPTFPSVCPLYVNHTLVLLHAQLAHTTITALPRSVAHQTYQRREPTSPAAASPATLSATPIKRPRCSSTLRTWETPKKGYPYNRSERGFPDVAAYALNFDVIIEGINVPLDGTSCASPTFAIVVSLLNVERRADFSLSPRAWFSEPLALLGGCFSAERHHGRQQLRLFEYDDRLQRDCRVGPGTFLDSAYYNPHSQCLQVTGLGTPNHAKLMEALGFKL